MCTLRKIDNFTEKIRDHILEYPDAYNIPDTTNREFHLTPEYTLYEVLDSNNNVIGFVLLLLTQKKHIFYNEEYEIMVGTFNKQGMLSNILRKILSDFPEPTFIAIIRKSNESRAKEYISQVLCQVGFLKEDTPENSDLSFCLNRNYNLHPTNFIRPNK